MAVSLICWTLWQYGCQSAMVGFVAVRLSVRYVGSVVVLAGFILDHAYTVDVHLHSVCSFCSIFSYTYHVHVLQ